MRGGAVQGSLAKVAVLNWSARLATITEPLPAAKPLQAAAPDKVFLIVGEVRLPGREPWRPS